MARWESPFIAEWVGYYYSIGFDHCYLYCNDDDPQDLYTAVQGFIDRPDPFVTFVLYPYRGQQWYIFLDFLRRYADETEWIGIFDVDEFLSLRSAPTIRDFMAERETRTDSVYFHWLYFGNSGHDVNAPGSVLRNYTKRARLVSRYAKAITRTDSIPRDHLKSEMRSDPRFVLPNHGWSDLTAPGMRTEDVLGHDMTGYYADPELFHSLYGDQSNQQRLMSVAVLHHYAFKSTSAFLDRHARGLDGEFAGQTHWRELYERGEHEPYLASLNAVEDTTLKAYWERYVGARHGIRWVMPPPAEPLASLGKPYIQSSVSAHVAPGAGGPFGATNGRPTGAFAFHTELEDRPWWQVDLEAVHALAEVRLYNRMESSELLSRASQFKICSSIDAKEWELGFATRQALIFGGVDGRPFVWRPQKKILGRYVRISLLTYSALHLDQVEVYGRRIAPG